MIKKVIDRFMEDYRWLSNFHLVNIKYEGIVYPSSEHAYQAAKSLDKDVRLSFLNLTCGQAKRLGGKIELRTDWEDIKYQVMLDILRIKFSNPFLVVQLLDTGDAELIEGNTWGDVYWGVCKGVGQNNLGKILMIIREEIRKTKADRYERQKRILENRGTNEDYRIIGEEELHD